MDNSTNQNIVHILSEYIKEWNNWPLASDLAGYETKCMKFLNEKSTKGTAQILKTLSRKGLVVRKKTKWGYVYSLPSQN